METYKFGDVTRLDGLGTNEVTMGWREKEKEKEGGGTGGMSTNLTSLALSYDLTPADCITALCTEVSRFEGYIRSGSGSWAGARA